MVASKNSVDIVTLFNKRPPSYNRSGLQLRKLVSGSQASGTAVPLPQADQLITELVISRLGRGKG
jgi:hypothetical protein